VLFYSIVFSPSFPCPRSLGSVRRCQRIDSNFGPPGSPLFSYSVQVPPHLTIPVLRANDFSRLTTSSPCLSSALPSQDCLPEGSGLYGIVPSYQGVDVPQPSPKQPPGRLPIRLADKVLSNPTLSRKSPLPLMSTKEERELPGMIPTPVQTDSDRVGTRQPDRPVWSVSHIPHPPPIRIVGMLCFQSVSPDTF